MSPRSRRPVAALPGPARIPGCGLGLAAGLLAAFTLGIWKHSRDQLRHAQAANARARAMAEHLADISHELRRPIGSMTLIASVLRRTADGPERERRLIEQLDCVGQRVTQALTSVLDYSRIEAGRVRIERCPTELRPFLEGLPTLFRVAAAEKGLVLALDPAPDLPERAWIDAARVQQVVDNLLANAIRVTDAGAIRIAVSANDSILRISVRDTGPGIAPEQQARLFERFEQGDASPRHEGFGLGLAIVRGLVEAMDGQVGCHSVAGQGSDFRFTIPTTPPNT